EVPQTRAVQARPARHHARARGGDARCLAHAIRWLGARLRWRRRSGVHHGRRAVGREVLAAALFAHLELAAAAGEALRIAGGEGARAVGRLLAFGDEVAGELVRAGLLDARRERPAHALLHDAAAVGLREVDVGAVGVSRALG